jgi:hypothetical protein
MIPFFLLKLCADGMFMTQRMNYGRDGLLMEMIVPEQM